MVMICDVFNANCFISQLAKIRYRPPTRLWPNYPYAYRVHSHAHQNCVFSHNVMAAIFVSQNNKTGAMFVSQTSHVGVSSVNAFFCCNKFAQMLATWVKTLYNPVNVTLHANLLTKFGHSAKGHSFRRSRPFFIFPLCWTWTETCC